MRAILLRDTRLLHKAGEIVEISPEQFYHLVNIGSAAPVKAAKPEPKKETKRKK